MNRCVMATLEHVNSNEDQTDVVTGDATADASNGEVQVTTEAPQPSPLDIMAADSDMMYDGRLDKSGKPNTAISSTALQSLKNYHIDHEKWMGWFRGYVRQDWDTISVPDAMSELKADWSELFFDLIYVACIVHISQEASYTVQSGGTYRRRMMMEQQFVDCPYSRRGLLGSSYGTTASGYGYGSDSVCDTDGEFYYTYLLTAFAQFGLLVKAWEGMIYYTSYFVMNQKMDEVFRVLYMVCVVTMGIFVHDEPRWCLPESSLFFLFGAL